MWAGTYRCAVCLSFDFDAESLWTNLGLLGPTSQSRGTYGAQVGVPRVLRLLDKHGVPATFFVPGVTVDRYPDIVREIHGKGHEIGHHSYLHTTPVNMTFEEERSAFERAYRSIVTSVGVEPKGYRSPAWELSPNSLGIMREHGIVYDSSMMAQDDPYRITMNGQDTGMVELPPCWELDDFPHFAYNYQPEYWVGLSAASKVFEIWKDEFDGAYDEGGLFLLTMHPQVIGKRHRIAMLDRLIEYIKGHKGVWFATHLAVAQDFLDQQKE